MTVTRPAYYPKPSLDPHPRLPFRAMSLPVTRASDRDDPNARPRCDAKPCHLMIAHAMLILTSTCILANTRSCCYAMPCTGPPGYDYACGGQCSSNNVCCYTAYRTYAPCPGGEQCTNDLDTGYDVCCAVPNLLFLLNPGALMCCPTAEVIR